MNIDDVINELEKIRETYGNAPCYLIGDYVASDDLDFIKVYGANKVVFFNKRDDWTKSCEEKLSFEKRIENLEKVVLMLQDEVDKKLEILRENNNLFATEIQKLGGFKEDELKLSKCEDCKYFDDTLQYDYCSYNDKYEKITDKSIIQDWCPLLDFEALDLSPIKEICNAFEKVYGKEDKNCKYHFKIEEHGSCYTLDKIVFNDKLSSIATIWFDDVFTDSNMLSKSKAYEIIQNIKKYLEKVE